MSELNYGQFNISQQLAVFVHSLYAKHKCLCFVHKSLCSNPCIQDECLQGLAVGAIRRYPCIHLNSTPSLFVLYKIKVIQLRQLSSRFSSVEQRV